MKKNILLTGVTGLLGSYIASLILRSGNDNLFLLVRGKSEKEAQARCFAGVESILKKSLGKSFASRLNVFRGEVEKKDLGLSLTAYKKLLLGIDEIYHCAAATGFNLPLDFALSVNLEGTANVLKFAENSSKKAVTHYISTTFILGNKAGVLGEQDLCLGQGFNNSYEESKYRAELLVEDFRRKGMSIYIFRPSIISGSHEAGETKNFKMFYETLKLFSLGIFDSVPVDLEVEHNLIPVDIAAEAIYILSTKESKPGNFHIVNPNNIRCFDFMDKAADFFGYKNPQWKDIHSFDDCGMTPIQKRLISPFLPYFNYKGRFDGLATRSILSRCGFYFPKLDDLYFRKMFNFCATSGFIRKK